MESNFSMSEAANNKDRSTVQSFLQRRIPEVGSAPVPLVELDYATDPTVLQIHDETGSLVAAASAGATLAVSLIRAKKCFPSRLKDYLAMASKIRELDLIAVDEQFRNQGLASRLLTTLEEKYKNEGVKILYGNVADEKNEISLTNFYKNRGYIIVQKLPPFFGLEWICSDIYSSAPTFYFYKKLN